MSQLENLEEILSNFGGTSREFLTQKCATWAGNETPIFQNCNSLGQSRHPDPLGENIDRCMIGKSLQFAAKAFLYMNRQKN